MTDEGFFLTPEEIYEQITGGAGERSLHREQEATTRELANERRRAELARSLAVDEGQQALADRAAGSADNLNRAQELLTRQRDAFRTAYEGVRPVSGPPKGSLDEKFPFDVDHEMAIRNYQDDARHNIEIYRAYDEASHDHETAMPRGY